VPDEEAPRVFEASGGLCVRYRGRLLYSDRDPARLPRRVGAACDPGPARLHLVPSPLLWYGMAELLASMGSGSAVLCVEADPELERIARERMPRELAADGRVSFVAARDVGRAVEAARSMGSFRACSLAALSGGESLNAPLYRAMARAISAELEADWRNRAALMLLGERWARNIFDNLAALPEIDPEPLPRIRGAAAVCGAGPSLEAALPFLSRERARLSVVACDTALGTLLASGIVPDLVVCLEAQAYNISDFVPLGGRPAAIAADLSSHPLSFRATGGPRHLTLSRITESPFLSRLAARLGAAGVSFVETPPLGSVGVHAAHLAALASRGPILAVGLDFCFEAGKTHARGCPSILAEERRLGRLRRWPGQIEASFRERNVGVGGFISDPVLLSYAGLLSTGREGPLLLDLRGRGPSIGARSATFEEAAMALGASRGTGSPSDRPPEGEPSGAARSAAAAARREGLREAAAAAIDDELSRIKRLRAGTRGGASGGDGTRAEFSRAEFSRAEFSRLLGESDYLFWSFPDSDRVEALPQDFLNRLAPRLEYWSWRLGGLRERLAEARA
jgi:hypothetical protein